MAYASQQNMIDRFGNDELVQLTDRADPPAGVINADILAAAQADADALIDSYIRKRYALPLATVPSMLRRASETIAYYLLHRERVSEEVQKFYDDTLSYLNKVSKGDVLLDINGLQPESSPAEASVDAPPRMFNRYSMRDL